jgi:crotonobetainyl-CoA:carnitine CoA-transferase CaiB-like acyl-CoA transferase
VPVGDFVTGLYAALSILAGLEARRRDGRSQRVDCAMLSSLLGISALQTSQFWGTGIAPEALGSAHPRNAPYQGFWAEDVQFVMAAGNDLLWQRVAEVVGRTDLVDDPRFRTQRDRAEHQTDLVGEIAPVFRTRPARHWLDELSRRGVPCGPVNTYADILDDPQVQALGLLSTLGLPGGGTTPTVRYPALMPEGDLPAPRRAPALGEGAESVFEEWLS